MSLAGFTRFFSYFRTFASNQELFEKVEADLKTLTEEPDVNVKLQMYALFKQATTWHVQGSRPGMMDFAGRAKFDAWTKVKGITKLIGFGKDRCSVRHGMFVYNDILIGPWFRRRVLPIIAWQAQTCALGVGFRYVVLI